MKFKWGVIFQIAHYDGAVKKHVVAAFKTKERADNYVESSEDYSPAPEDETFYAVFCKEMSLYVESVSGPVLETAWCVSARVKDEDGNCVIDEVIAKFHAKSAAENYVEHRNMSDIDFIEFHMLEASQC